MIDWFVLLTPLLLLPVVMLFAFLGCMELFPPPPPPSKLRVHVHFPAPDGEEIDDLFVDVIITDVVYTDQGYAAESALSPDQDEPVLRYEFEFTLEPRDYGVICSVFGETGIPIIQSTCYVRVEGEYTDIYFDAAVNAEDADAFVCS